MLKQLSINPAALTAPARMPEPPPISSCEPVLLSPERLKIAEAVDRLLSFYPPLDVVDAQVFISGIIAILAQYPPELIAIATDPTGIPRKLKALRSLADIEEVCQDLYGPIARRIRRDAIARAPKLLPRPPRSVEEQARIDAQVASVRQRFGLAP